MAVDRLALGLFSFAQRISSGVPTVIAKMSRGCLFEAQVRLRIACSRRHEIWVGEIDRGLLIGVLAQDSDEIVDRVFKLGRLETSEIAFLARCSLSLANSPVEPLLPDFLVKFAAFFVESSIYPDGRTRQIHLVERSALAVSELQVSNWN